MKSNIQYLAILNSCHLIRATMNDIIFFYPYLFSIVRMSTESVPVHLHKGNMYSGKVDYRKHSSSTRSSWGARWTQSCSQDMGEDAYQSLSVSFFSFFFSLIFDRDIGSSVCMREVSSYGPSCCWIILFAGWRRAKERRRKEIKQSFCILTRDNLNNGGKSNTKMHGNVQWQRLMTLLPV